MRLGPSSQRRDTSAWTIVVIALVMLACVAVAMFGAQRADVTRGVVGVPGMFHHGTITSLDALVNEARPESLRARDVFLPRAAIADVRGDRVFLLEADGRAIPVVTFEPATRTRAFERGERVRIHGIVRLARDAGEILGRDRMSARELATLRAHRLYISAHRVAESSRARVAEIPRVITSVEQLARIADRDALVAREVVLDHVRVARVFGDYTFLVRENGATVPVVLLGELTGRQAEAQTTIERGDVVRIYGIVRRLHSVGEIEDLLMLSPGEAAELRAHDVYISALRVVELGPSS